MSELLKVHELAEILKVPPSWVYQNTDKIPGRFKLGKYWRFRRAVIEKWLDGHKEE